MFNLYKNLLLLNNLRIKEKKNTVIGKFILIERNKYLTLSTGDMTF